MSPAALVINLKNQQTTAIGEALLQTCDVANVRIAYSKKMYEGSSSPAKWPPDTPPPSSPPSRVGTPFTSPSSSPLDA